LPIKPLDRLEINDKKYPVMELSPEGPGLLRAGLEEERGCRWICQWEEAR
jgi:hypothetical protein